MRAPRKTSARTRKIFHEWGGDTMNPSSLPPRLPARRRRYASPSINAAYARIRARAALPVSNIVGSLDTKRTHSYVLDVVRPTRAGRPQITSPRSRNVSRIVAGAEARAQFSINSTPRKRASERWRIAHRHKQAVFLIRYHFRTRRHASQ